MGGSLLVTTFKAERGTNPVVGAQGRVVIPSAVREAIGLATGDRLVISVQGRGLTLDRPEDAVVQLRSLSEPLAAGRSLVEELLADRRAAAADE